MRAELLFSFLRAKELDDGRVHNRVHVAEAIQHLYRVSGAIAKRQSRLVVGLESSVLPESCF